jgi:hypothetical protein
LGNEKSAERLSQTEERLAGFDEQELALRIYLEPHWLIHIRKLNIKNAHFESETSKG